MKIPVAELFRLYRQLFDGQTGHLKSQIQTPYCLPNGIDAAKPPETRKRYNETKLITY